MSLNQKLAYPSYLAGAPGASDPRWESSIPSPRRPGEDIRVRAGPALTTISRWGPKAAQRAGDGGEGVCLSGSLRFRARLLGLGPAPISAFLAKQTPLRVAAGRPDRPTSGRKAGPRHSCRTRAEPAPTRKPSSCANIPEHQRAVAGPLGETEGPADEGKHGGGTNNRPPPPPLGPPRPANATPRGGTLGCRQSVPPSRAPPPSRRHHPPIPDRGSRRPREPETRLAMGCRR